MKYEGILLAKIGLLLGEEGGGVTHTCALQSSMGLTKNKLYSQSFQYSCQFSPEVFIDGVIDEAFSAMYDCDVLVWVLLCYLSCLLNTSRTTSNDQHSLSFLQLNK